MKITYLLFLCSFAFLGLNVQARPCLSDSQLNGLQQAEARYLVEKIPPAYKHAYDDQKIKVSMLAVESNAPACIAQLTVTLPDDDIAAAKQLLDQDPAKRIVLFSQGYSLPESNTSIANFTVDPSNNKIAYQDVLQTAALGKLRASTEMMYALLSQSRASVDLNTQNNATWRPEFRESQVKACRLNSATEDGQGKACECQSDKLSRIVSERQLDNIYYVRTNPYAKATGAIKSFDAIEKDINSACGILAKATVK